MKLYFLQRLLYLLATLLILLQVSFIIYYQGTGSHAQWFPCYLQFYQHLFTGNWGANLHQSQQLIQQWWISFSATLELCLLTITLSLAIGLPLGIASGLSHRRRYHNAVKLFYLLAVTIPTLWISLLIVALFNDHFNLFPPFSYYARQNFQSNFIEFRLFNLWKILQSGNEVQLIGLLKRLVLTLSVLILVPTAQIMQLSRVNTELLTRQNYIQAAIARGNNRLLLIYRHILRNLLPILLPRLYFIFPLILTLCLSIEAIYGWPGMGSWALNAFYQHNYFIIALITLTLGSLNALSYMLCELLQFIVHLRNVEVPYVI